MLLYIASSFTMAEELDEIALLLELQGHHVLVRWWERAGLKKKFAPLDPIDFYSHPECEFAFNTDKEAVREADALILVVEKETLIYNGANVELGMAIEREIPVFSIGHLQNSALYFPLMRCESVHEVIELLELME